MKIKSIIIFVLLVVIVYEGYVLISMQNQLKKTIKQHEHQLINIRHKRKISDSICANLWKHIPFGSPVKTPIISSEFGLRRDPFTRRWRKHEGIDFKGNYKDTVYSTGGGYIEKAGYNGGYGKCVIINHGKGYKTMYAHLSRIYVVKGEYVNDHHSIGRIGSTGHSTGPHLHYEVFKNDEHINPDRFIWVKL